MNESNRTQDWIAAYIEWANIEEAAIKLPGTGSDVVGEPGDDPSDLFAAAYLEWMEEHQARPAGHSQFSPEADVRHFGGANVGGVTLGKLRETVLLEALRTESDCIHMLRQTLDWGGASGAALRFAIETIERADRLVEDERHAWQLLRALHPSDLRRVEGPASGIDAEDEWSHALDGLMADMHLLTGQIVLAMQAR